MNMGVFTAIDISIPALRVRAKPAVQLAPGTVLGQASWQPSARGHEYTDTAWTE